VRSQKDFNNKNDTEGELSADAMRTILAPSGNVIHKIPDLVFGHPSSNLA
jgi:hypothetical protein